ncbi:hypothetical protein SLS62_010174 [Diatrype stigma]|uniref:ARID domain-containing protein n=1 Tax=Diatrype stigma TaxID=117547 RepID=A0AAN9UDJ3_9PEZI
MRIHHLKEVKDGVETMMKIKSHYQDRPDPGPPPDGDVGDSEVEASSYAEKDLKKQFYDDYQTFADDTESQAQWWPTIKGQTFELWELWQAVQSQKVDAEERDWQQISETLGFNWVEDPDIPADIRHCYQMHLGDFEAGLLAFEEQSDDEDETQANAILGAPLASSPALPPLKRSYDTALGPSHSYPSSPPKRARYARDNEVPSTPDDKNGTSHLRRQTIPSGVESPTLGSHDTPNFNPSRMPATTPGSRNSRSQSTLEEVESQVNITPSQQLRSEFDARSEEVVTPTPARTARDPFIQDELEEADNTPKASTEHTNARSSDPSPPKSKRRSLPSSFNQPRFTRASDSPASRPQRQSPLPQAKPQTPARETPEDIIDFYMSLGYAQDVVVRSLDVTTWVPGLASQLMEMLKRGESLPTNWRGVWTQKDDEVLREVAADDQPPRGDAKEQRKKEKRLERLEKKHTREGMDLRKAFLEARDREKRVKFAVGGSR